jgi:hypothetical protein
MPEMAACPSSAPPSQKIPLRTPVFQEALWLMVLEQINLMMTLYSYRHQKRANVCRSVPPLTRGGQEGFAAVKSAFLHDLLLKTPLISPLSGGKWTDNCFRSHPTAASCDGTTSNDECHPLCAFVC